MTRPGGRHAWSAADYAANARFVSDLGGPLLAQLSPQPGERILDLGCGDGALAAAIAATGARVHGIDASPEMIAAARDRGLDVAVADGQALSFDHEFDAVFTNAALHWMPDPDAVVAGVARALRPGGRFVGEFGGHGNVAAIVTALHAALRPHGPPTFRWYFPTAEQYAALLGRHGFTLISIALIPRPTILPTGMAGWLATFAGPFLATLSASDRRAILHETEALLTPSLKTQDGTWIADYVRLRFEACTPADPAATLQPPPEPSTAT